jgi:peptidyl-prolyl cis-trans isomerase B (cyclophilin B)
MIWIMVLLPLAVLGDGSDAARRQRPGTFFTSQRPIAELQDTQAVVETSAGAIVIDLLPDAAPNHVAYFVQQAERQAYDGTVFHRVIKHGIIQGGDPLSKDPSKAAQYGTGGLGVLKAEINAEKHTRGAVSAVQIPGRPDSAGAQFFICITDQPALDGRFTVFGRLVEGIEVAQKISETAADADGRPAERIEIRSVRIRKRPGPEAVPFATAAAGEMGAYVAALETSAGTITIRFFADKAPAHVRNFLRLATLGVYDGTSFHRVVPGFVIQTGSMSTRAAPLTQAQQRHVSTLQPEFNDTAHVKGIVSMARGDDPASASTSFFICTGTAASLDGKYTAFGEVVSGMDVVERIEKTPVQGETPLERITLLRVRLEKP